MKRLESVIALASQQHGVVRRTQLLETGASVGWIDRRVRAGLFEVVHRGVYRLGPVTSPRMADMAAALASGPNSAISHRSAGRMWDLLPGEPLRPVSVTVVCAHLRGRRPGIVPHRTEQLAPDEVTSLDGVPVTTVPRTLIDIADGAGAQEVERLVARALRLELCTEEALHALAMRHAHRRGVVVIRACTGAGEPAFVRSDAEALLLTLLRTAGLPAPSVNARLRGVEVDFLWRREKLVVEVDGFAYHSSARAFEQDRARDAALVAAGMRVMRFTWRQLQSEPHRVTVRIAQALVLAA